MSDPLIIALIAMGLWIAVVVVCATRLNSGEGRPDIDDGPQTGTGVAPTSVHYLFPTTHPRVSWLWNIVDQVHDMPATIKPLRVHGDETHELHDYGDSLAYYWPGRSLGLTNQWYAYSRPFCAPLHELGHALDDALHPDTGVYWSSSDDPLAVALRKLVDERARYLRRSWSAFLASPHHLTYMNTHTEWFARLYVQWIAHHSHEPRLRNVTFAKRSRLPRAVRPKRLYQDWAYWPAERFAVEIAPLFDQLLHPKRRSS